jgi:hypothetical protein
MDVTAGQRLTALHDVTVHVLVHWQAPMTSGLTVRVSAGEVVAVESSPPLTAELVACRPVEYATFEREHVPDRDTGKYDGYTILVPLSEIGTVWDLDP